MVKVGRSVTIEYITDVDCRSAYIVKMVSYDLHFINGITLAPGIFRTYKKTRQNGVSTNIISELRRHLNNGTTCPHRT